MSESTKKSKELVERLYGKAGSKNSIGPGPAFKTSSLPQQRLRINLSKSSSTTVLPVSSSSASSAPGKHGPLAPSTSASILPTTKAVGVNIHVGNQQPQQYPKKKMQQWVGGGGGGGSTTPNKSDSYDHFSRQATSPSSFIASLCLDPRYLEEFHSGNFIYLRQKSEMNATVYDLEVVEHYEVNPQNYYTMSVEGVTHFTKTNSEFLALNVWEKEYDRFMKMRRIPFFQKYRSWKNFRVWKKNIRQSRTREAKAALESSLYILNPFFRKVLLTLQENCIQICSIDLIGLKALKGSTITITDFETHQTKVRANALNQLQLLSIQNLQMVLHACDTIVDHFLEENKISVDHKMTFMERAALKKECKSLANFLRLGDYLVIDATLSLALGFLKAMESHFASTIPASFLFKVGVDYSDTTQQKQLCVSPGQEEFATSIERIIKESLLIVETPERLLGHAALKMYTSAGSEEFDTGMGSSGGAGSSNNAAEEMNMAMILNDDPNFNASTNALFSRTEELFESMESYLAVFNPFIHEYVENQRKLLNVSEEYGNATAGEIEAAIEALKEQGSFLQTMPESTIIHHVFIVDSFALKNQFTPSSQAVIKAIQPLLPLLIMDQGSVLVRTLNELNPLAMSIPTDATAFVSKMKHMKTVTGMLPNLKSRFATTMDLFTVLEHQGLKSGNHDDIKEIAILMKEGISSLEKCLTSFEATVDEDSVRFSQLLLDSIPDVMRQVDQVSEALTSPLLSHVTTNPEQVLAYLFEEDETLTRLQGAAKVIQDEQEMLKQDLTEFEALDETRMEMNGQLGLWKGVSNWHKLEHECLETRLHELELDLLQKEIGGFFKTANQSVKAFPQNETAKNFRKNINEFKSILPIVEDLRSPHLQPRHWSNIDLIFGFSIQEDETMTLAKLHVMNAHEYSAKISAIAVAAQQEAVLEGMFDKIKSIWHDLEFEVRMYKDSKESFVLGTVEEVMVHLDESIVNVSTILASRFAGPLQESVDGFRKKLLHFQETLDEWLSVQKNWMYLENIFSSGDIQRQLPEPSKLFQQVDTSWKSIMKRTNENPLALAAGTYPGLKETLQLHNAHLDKIQKSLEDYLETKRMAFPRFYFLSNDELLEILGQSKDPVAVQPHLRKCFENLVELEFDLGAPGGVDMTAMLSSEGERIAFQKPLKARGPVEDWLRGLENLMKLTIHKLMKAGLEDYDTKARPEWVLAHPGQVVATVAQMTWARNTEIAFRQAEGHEAMSRWYADVLDELNSLIIKIRGSLTNIERKVIVALVTTDVHARDIVDFLCTEKVSNQNNFIWQQQLRYYWDLEIDDVLIRHSDAAIEYGYEYMGATSRLVITPLTDRCWMTLTGAYGLKLGASPAGPAGTGKTESSKDLAKAMAIQCVVFNCSDQIDYKMMGKLFRGLAQAGNWTCLDEFNRIDIEVLSVVAQQLLILREGRLQQREFINFMGVEIPLRDHHVIVTMNPGYAGRTELPDNLKICFRPVSMMVPDYALIAEIMLFAEGFGDAKKLSRKMCKLYILCSEQLSQQPHYDYGLRAVKSVLVMAGSLKRANPDQSEDVTLIRALRDSNVPKFLPQDLPLFQAIVCDLFPGIDLPVNDFGEIEACLRETMTGNGLEAVPAFMNKIIQLFDTFNVRFGVTVVGPAGAGKTTCYQQLQQAMTRLHDDAGSTTNALYRGVQTSVLNPKCITMGELYGEFHPMTQEWHDGLASTIMREAVQDTSTDDIKWTVFDGPIDALWIENMNTVLDDNMTLCLANGERIKLRQEMRMLFEVMDLAVASPATVSRIGVVYMTPADLGWRPYANSWMARLELPDSCIARLEENIHRHLQMGLDYLRKFGTEPVPTQDINIIMSFCRLFGSLVSRLMKVENDAPPVELTLTQMDVLFVFSFVWSVGGTMEASCRPAFSTFCEDIFSTGECQPKLTSDCTDLFSFVPDASGVCCPWTKIVPEFSYSKTLPFFDLLVPTPDNVRYTFLLSQLTRNAIPCYLTGVTGSGKTVLIQKLLQQLEAGETNDYITMTMNFSAQTLSVVSQMAIESKLEKKRRGVLGPPGGKRMVIFVDDINMPAVEEYGAQPPIELLRQFVDFNGLYDREKLFWKSISDTQLLVSSAPAGGGRSHCTPRFVRHFHVLCMEDTSKDSMTRIFEAILGGFLSDFQDSVKILTKGIVSSIIEVYNSVSQELLPTPSKFHYTFNLRDVSRIFQGILMISPSKKVEPEMMHKLWIHESTRVFQDRLNSQFDQCWFEEAVCGLLQANFGLSWSSDEIFRGPKPLIFGDFFRPSALEPTYECCQDWTRAVKVLDDQLEEYNLACANPMNLVFFNDAIRHIVALTRVFRQPRGNALLIGVGGSGKQSVTKLAAFIERCELFCIEITRGYGVVEFREDIKVAMRKAGVDGQSVAFLFNDSQIVDEGFVEDLNNLLNSGEIPNLFPQDELDKIIADMRPVVKELGRVESRDSCLETFVMRVREFLHIALCMSPVGSALRVRCRAFPSLINCCTIDWYMNWPQDALQSVARRLLSEVPLPSEDIRENLVFMCTSVHLSSESAGDAFYSQLQRYVYTTPKSYLDLIGLFLQILKEKQGEVQLIKDRMMVGVAKLSETNEIVDNLKEDLIKLQPILKTKAIEAEKLLKQVAIDQVSASEVRERVTKDEEEVAEQAAEVSEIQADAQRDLDIALPAMENAVNALDSLSKSDITEVKSFKTPPEAVKTVMEAVCILLGAKTDWDAAKKVLGDASFMDKLKNYDKDNINPSYLKKLAKYIADPGMAVEVVKKVSKAATSLCMWVHAMDVYSRVAKEVEPKRAKLEIMNKKLQEANTILAGKRAELDAVNKKVERLEADCKRTVDEKQSLADEASQTEQRLIRAAKLMSGLSSEGVRWKESVNVLSEKVVNTVGDAFLSAACISYFGAFTGPFRSTLVDTWLGSIEEFNIPSSAPYYSLAGTMSTPVQIREWQLSGLPTDDVSTDSAILVTRGQRWPLMIDPQNQAKKWIKTIEASNSLEITRMNNINLLRSLEACIRVGKPLLIEDIGETIEPSLEPVLQKSIYIQGGRKLIHLGDSDVDYDDNFKLYLTTKFSNPHYLPEVFIKVTVINFTVTLDGLEDQLLGDVVKREQPEIETRKARLVMSMSQDRKQLQEIEARILKLLSESSGNVLDDEVLIDTLASSNATSTIIKERVLEAEKTEVEINLAREQYRPAAVRGAIMYFVIADLAKIDTMYQYSLTFFQKLFGSCVDESPKFDRDVSRRIESIIEYMTYTVYANICRGLFEVHKTLFSSLLCCRICLRSGEISSDEWTLLLRGPRNVDRTNQPKNPQPARMTELQWDLMTYLEHQLKSSVKGSNSNSSSEGGESEVEVVPAYDKPFDGICENMIREGDKWTKWLSSEVLEKDELPTDYGSRITMFQFILLLKALAEDKIQWGIMQLVKHRLGPRFCQSTNVTMQDIYNDIDHVTPCIFILSAGADPTSMLLRFAKEREYGDRLHIVSLGQGQGPRAEALINQSRVSGDWVLLQNCHLAKSWMNNLEKIVDDLSSMMNPSSSSLVSDDDNRALDFRLYLTSFPAAYFPVAVLQNGIKLTNEPPRGMRANILRSLGMAMDPEMYAAMDDLEESSFQQGKGEGKGENENDNPPVVVVPKSRVWQKLLGGLLFFHATVQERRKFGPLGWNIQYEFNDADLETSVACLKKFLIEQPDVPWDALRYVTGEINYGGRVTDDWDRRCLVSILSKFYTPEIIHPRDYRVSPSGTYYVPNDVSYEELRTYLTDLPEIDPPELFGMHDNAIVTFEKNESQKLLTTILGIEPRDTSGGGGGSGSTDAIVLTLLESIEDQMPEPLSREEAGETTFRFSDIGGIQVMDSLATVLSQEMEKFNRLLRVMTSSLVNLRRAINGLVVMSSDLDMMYLAFVNNQVPPIWERVSFASLKGLGSWVKDLMFRMQFFRRWLHHGQPQAFPLSVFFFPQGFLTGTLQNYARKYLVAIDQLSFEFNVLRVNAPLTIAAGEGDDAAGGDAGLPPGPDDGVHIYGLQLEGAQWDMENHTLIDAKANEMYSSMPLVHFLPTINVTRSKTDYATPVYKTSARQGTLSTTGISTNFVVAVYLPTTKEPDYWVLQGTAFLLNLDD